MENSWYHASANWSHTFPKLEDTQRFDVCVVGAGITGLTTALHLAEAGYSVAIVESHYVGYGASGRSGGQMIFGFAAEQPTIEKLVGKDNADVIWQAGLEGLDLLRARVEKHAIDCDLVHGQVNVAVKKRHIDELKQWQESLEDDYGYSSLTFWNQDRVREEVNSPRYLAGLHDSNSGHIHPLNYTLGLARAADELGIKIFEHSPVRSVTKGDPVIVSTDDGEIISDFVVLAGNAYLPELGMGIYDKVMPVGTYICASEVLGEAQCKELIRNNAAVCDINFVLDYFRLSNDFRMLFGGRVSYSTLAPADLEKSMGERMKHVFPQLQNVKIDFAWGGNVAITMNRAPHFGRVDNNIFFAQGFSGHGIAATGLAGKLMSDAIQGTAEKFDVFSKIPHHSFPGGRLFRTPALVLAMAWYRLQDLLP
ncbi:NAD(P)/FAD-dependent oxidoreductase [Sessilibacter corallicola]|uniref:FAD-binding oxidoreductase n=1 Tax=Sessilibacter corallicola TaxID=2904075 RepID=A0ABQ0A5C0_9GAMM